MKRAALCVLAAALVTACGGGSPTAPSSQVQTGLLTGTWNGTMTITPAGLPAVSAPVTWRFELITQTAGTTYRTTITSQHPFLAPSIAASTTLVPPATPPSDVSTQGTYASPRGCQGLFSSEGTTTAARMTGSFHGVDCGLTFTGTIELSR